MMQTLSRKISAFLILATLLIPVGLWQFTLASVHGDELHSLNTRSVQAISSDYVYACTLCDNPALDVGLIGYGFDYQNRPAYAPQVLTNEWPSASQTQALRAGAVTVHTFAWRDIGGCGAIQRTRESYPGGPEYRVLNNCTQRYWLGDPPNYSCYVQSGQNPIANTHRDAVQDTLTERIYRSDWQHACAKYFADCGNPTRTCVSGPGGDGCYPEDVTNLQGIPDPVDSGSSPYVPGLSQNGTHAWELSGYAGAAPWDYRQMLSHYYTRVRVPNADYDYRWVWLDVTSGTKFGRYYGPLGRTPTTMQTGRAYGVPMRIKNTGNSSWSSGGSNPVRLSYHWYDAWGNKVIWDGLRTGLGQDVSPAGEVTLNPKVVAPSRPGSYVLKWDMLKEWVKWFNWDDNWPTQDVTVNVAQSPGLIFLPDVKNNGGWVSRIIVRNNNSAQAAVDVTFLTTEADVSSSIAYSVPPGGTRTATPPSGFSGSAMVAASQDVTVVAENQYSNSRAYAYNGVAAADGLNPGWGPVGTTLYAPVIMRDYWDWYSQLTLLNTGSAPTTVQVTYYRSSDGQSHTDSHYLPPSGSLTTNHGGAAANTLYAARITASQPLAATVRQYRGGVNETYNGFSAGATTAYAPLIMNNYYGWDTSVNVQNLSASTASIRVQYYDAAGQPAGTAHNDTLPPYASRSYYSPAQGLPEGFIGTARVTSSNQQPIAVVVNQSAPHGGSPRRGKSYSASLSGSVWVVIPDLANHAGSEEWVSSVNVRNLGTTSTVATLTFAGQAVNSPTLPPNGFHSFYVPNHWGTTSLRGPATVSSSGGQPLAVVVNHSAYGQTQVDLEHSYNGANR